MLLDAALEAFATDGFDGASIRDVTGAVGVGHNLIRHYFGSKEDLWRAAMHHGLEDACERLIDLLRDEDRPARETMRAAVDLLVDEASVNTAAIRVLVAEATRGGPRFDYLFDHFIGPIGAALAESGDDRSGVSIELTGLFTFSAVFGSVSMTGLLDRLGLTLPKAGGDDALPRQLTDLVLHGTLGRE